jgi:hypothetical protein
MADTSVVDLNADLVCLGRCNLDVLNGQILACFPGDCGLIAVSSISCKIDAPLSSL